MEDFKNIPLRGVQPAGYSPAEQGEMAADIAGNLLGERSHRGLHAA